MRITSEVGVSGRIKMKGANEKGHIRLNKCCPLVSMREGVIHSELVLIHLLSAESEGKSRPIDKFQLNNRMSK